MSETIFGTDTPAYNPGEIHQIYPDTCAIKCQSLILETFGQDISEDQLRGEAESLKWYVPGGGTPAEDLGKLLELHGVNVARFEGANQYTLMHELAQGHQVMVALDSNEIWEPGILQRLLDFLGLSGADHALIVSGIDTTDPNDIQVIVSDPGTGNVARYPYEQFADAWADSSFTMVSTTEAPVNSPLLENMDSGTGILDSIMGIDIGSWMDQFGDMIQTGIELGKDVADFVEEHPELIRTVVAASTFLAAGSVEVDTGCESGGVDIDV